MKLLFIFTGGTIGSIEKDHVIATSSNQGYRILRAYDEAHGISFAYDTSQPYTELSENNTGWHFKTLADCIANHINRDYDGIIVTHGTDTLQYSAAAIGYAFGLHTIPICFVSANAPIDHPNSNAMDNLHGAIRFIESQSGKGCFVVYRNADSDVIQVHRGTRLLGGKSYSDALSSVNECAYGQFDHALSFIKNPRYTEKADELAPLFPSNLTAFNDAALVLPSYPGMAYPKIEPRIRYIILNTYHSGTIHTASKEAKAFFLSAKEQNIPVYVTGISEGAQYESTMCFSNLGIRPIVSLSPVAAYIKLWLIHSLGADPTEMLSLSLSGDMVC